MPCTTSLTRRLSARPCRQDKPGDILTIIRHKLPVVPARLHSADNLDIQAATDGTGTMPSHMLIGARRNKAG